MILPRGNPLPALPQPLDGVGWPRYRRHQNVEEESGWKISRRAQPTTGQQNNGFVEFIERIEHLEAEKKDISEQIKEVYAECKGRGYDTKAIRALISLRRRDQDDIAEEEAILEMYKSALGMS